MVDSPYFTDLSWLYLLRTHINAEGKQRLRQRFGYRVHLDPDS